MSEVRRQTVLLPRPSWGWQDKAACKGADVVLFFGPDGERQPERDIRERQAKVLCGSCPVQMECQVVTGRSTSTALNRSDPRSDSPITYEHPSPNQAQPSSTDIAEEATSQVRFPAPPPDSLAISSSYKQNPGASTIPPRS